VSDTQQLELARHFASLAELLAGDDQAGPVPERVIRVARAALGGAEHAGLSLLEKGRRPRTVAATDEVVRTVDELQYALQEGPCWEAAVDSDVVRTGDLRRETRWGSFGPRCADRTGICSMLSVRLRLPGGDRAAMNFYAEATDAYSAADEGVAALFAPFAALALRGTLASDRAENLEGALLSSRLIGTAIGILMARDLLSDEQALQQLIAASQHLNR